MTKSNVAERTFDSPADALALLDFDPSDVVGPLSDVKAAVYGEQSAGGFRLAFSFRALTLGIEQEAYPKKTGWVKLRCDLTGMHFAVPKLAPVPQILIFQGDTLEGQFVVHPDFLEDRSHLLEMLVSRLEEDLAAALYRARQAASLLNGLSTMDELPGLSPEARKSYPGGDGFEAIGRRPADASE